jgi:hypothetical protein
MFLTFGRDIAQRVDHFAQVEHRLLHRVTAGFNLLMIDRFSLLMGQIRAQWFTPPRFDAS